MQKAVEAFSDQILAIRPGVVSGAMIEAIKVNGTLIKHMATVTENKGIVIKAFDPQQCGAIQKTLEATGHSCYLCKNVVMVNIPKFMTSADKERATALIRKLEEDAKVILRNIRQKAKQKISGSEDEVRKAEKELQTLTDKYVSQVAVISNNKVKTLI